MTDQSNAPRELATNGTGPAMREQPPSKVESAGISILHSVDPAAAARRWFEDSAAENRNLGGNDALYWTMVIMMAARIDLPLRDGARR